jgi:hypothetical protein
MFLPYEDTSMNSPSSVSATENAARPFWVPDGVSLDSLPEELKIAIAGIVNPAYQELVVSASSGLEQSTGLTIVHLLWLEVLDQIELGKKFAEHSDEADTSKHRETLIARYLRLVGAKTKTSNFLLRLHDFRQKWGSFPAAPDPLNGTCDEPGDE